MLLALNISLSFGQTEQIFNVKETKAKGFFSRKMKLTKPTHAFYEDSLYTCSCKCYGEWGGSISLEEKKSQSPLKLTFSASCPVNVVAYHGKYIVTNTLAHLSGFSSVEEIDLRDSLSMQRWMAVLAEDPNLHLTAEILLDEIGVLTLGSFVYQDQLYQVVTDFEKTYVAKIQDKKFEFVQLISNISMRSYDLKMFLTDEGHSIVFFKNAKAKGYLDIFENNIQLVRYK